MKQKRKAYSNLQIDAMLKMRYGKIAEDDNLPSFASYELLGQLFKCSASKVRQLIQARFEDNLRLKMDFMQ